MEGTKDATQQLEVESKEGVSRQKSPKGPNQGRKSKQHPKCSNQGRCTGSLHKTITIAYMNENWKHEVNAKLYSHF